MGLESVLTNMSNKVHFIFQGNDVINLDCSVSEKHSRESPPTEFEVENGQTINDHIIVKPFDLSIEGIISDTPLSLLTQLITAGVSYLLPSASVLGKAASALALAPALFPTGSPYDRPSAKAYLQLLNIQSSGLPVDVWTSLFFYKNMWIKSISAPRTAKTGRMLSFTMELKQLRLVSPQTVNIAKFKSPDTSAGLADKGKAEANPYLQQAKAGFAAGTL